MKSLTLLIGILCFTLPDNHIKKNIKTPLWEISKRGNSKKSYILGIYHFANPAYIDSIPAIKQSFERSEILLNELNNNKNVTTNQPLYIEYEKFISPGKYDSISNWMKEVEFPSLDTLNKSKVPFIRIFGNLLNDFYSSRPKSNIPPAQSFDLVLAERAKNLGKKVIGLDQSNSKILSYEDELYNQSQLSEILYNTYKSRNNNDMNNYLNKLSNEYFTKFDHDYQFKKHLDTSVYFNKAIIYERNLKWLNIIDNHLSSNVSIFLSVGLSHLDYKEGLIELLRKQGYTVKPLDIK